MIYMTSTNVKTVVQCTIASVRMSEASVETERVIVFIIIYYYIRIES